jgi:hypothetical protein
VDVYKGFADEGVTDMLCAPWMSASVSPEDSPESRLKKRMEASERFAEEILEKMDR